MSDFKYIVKTLVMIFGPGVIVAAFIAALFYITGVGLFITR